ncbi:hypothetical protein NDU88_004452 [Pleurodeles waltl]|uniref:Uncharacterized protein n=1 Tax=Pleurodeles waltl TaxID=8319 RepID=A0AAV7MGN4_PLEWA|nr:hypothetical protein NDU88_004452 [Pleurodeles waltl]
MLRGRAAPRFCVSACQLLYSRSPSFLLRDLRRSPPPPASQKLRSRGPLPATRATRSEQVRNLLTESTPCTPTDPLGPFEAKNKEKRLSLGQVVPLAHTQSWASQSK